MRWRGRRRSSNIEDRRGMRASRGRMRLNRRTAGGGIGTIVIVLVAMYFGVDPGLVLQGLDPGAPPSSSRQQTTFTPEENELAEFVSVVLADTEDSWHNIFKQGGDQYQEPRLVLFSGEVQSACGFAQSAMGPFYCPGDQKIYIDLSFYNDMKTRFGAPGDFAQAYVVAHEVGHHVQNLLGISSKVHQAQRSMGTTEANRLSVRLELQADCLSGMWARHADRAKSVLESGDLDEALGAAAAIGDDRLQKQTQGRVVPESFTHGTSEQRVRWFQRGMNSDRIAQCDTFAAISR